MADPEGFLRFPRELPDRRPVEVRIRDWREIYEDFPLGKLRTQASRCMDCGIPFCHHGCPLGNLIPEWNELVRLDDWRTASERLHATNNFPEFTGRLCPAPCESSCVLAINSDAVTIKQIELEIIDRAWREGWILPQPPQRQTGKRVAVVGSGPAGLAAAQQLTRAGHDVTVYERSDRLGGLLRYGVPEFKMEKRHIERRLAQLAAEGTRFVTSCHVGVDIPAQQLRSEYDATVLATGATVPRDVAAHGRNLDGIHFAMDYLTLANRVQEGDLADSPISAANKHVVIIGGGDTGADCLGTAHRQGARSVVQLEINEQPPGRRPDAMPWPMYPKILRTSGAYEEGGERLFALSAEGFLADDGGHVRSLLLSQAQKVNGQIHALPNTEQRLPCDLALIAIGFAGAEQSGLLEDLTVAVDARGRVVRDSSWQTNVPGVFAAGDMARGQSLIVWAIAEGRAAASAVDAYLTGRTALPTAVTPTSAPLTL